MEQGPRFFTVEEANELVGPLQLEFGRVAQLRAEIGAAIEALGGAEIAAGVLQEGAERPPARTARPSGSARSPARSPPAWSA
jgi:hypothetical protein